MFYIHTSSDLHSCSQKHLKSLEVGGIIYLLANTSNNSTPSSSHHTGTDPISDNSLEKELPYKKSSRAIYFNVSLKETLHYNLTLREILDNNTE